MSPVPSSSTGRRGLVALLTMLLVIGAFAGPVFANHTIEIRNYDETAHECPGDGFKIEAQFLVEGEHRYEIYDNGTLLFAVTLDIALNTEGELAELVDWSNATMTVTAVHIFAGGQATLWPDHPLKEQGAHAGEPREISHISFCVTAPVATPTPTPTPADTPTPTPTEFVPTPTPADTPTPTPTDVPDVTPTPEQEGHIEIHKWLCEEVADSTALACFGPPDTSLAGWMIDFEVYAGTDTTAAPIGTITVTLGDNEQGQGNLGGGALGINVGGPFTAGETYTVCEVPVAYDGDNNTVDLLAYPRPAGAAQSHAPGDCIQIDPLVPGRTVLTFLDERVAVAPTPTPADTPTPTPTEFVPTPTPADTPTPEPTEVVPTPTPAFTPTPTPTDFVPTPAPTGTPPDTAVAQGGDSQGGALSGSLFILLIVGSIAAMWLVLRPMRPVRVRR
jgi:hypothetical protein